MARAMSGVGVERSRALASLIAIWLLLVVLYLLFAGSAGATEVLAAVVCASLGTLWARRAGRIGDLAFHLRVDMLRPLAAAVLSLPSQTLRVGFDLVRMIVDGHGAGLIEVRPMSSVFRHTPFDVGAEAQAGRALGVLAASLAPRSYVLRLDPARSHVVLHAFEPTSTQKGPA